MSSIRLQRETLSVEPLSLGSMWEERSLPLLNESHLLVEQSMCVCVCVCLRRGLFVSTPLWSLSIAAAAGAKNFTNNRIWLWTQTARDGILCPCPLSVYVCMYVCLISDTHTHTHEPRPGTVLILRQIYYHTGAFINVVYARTHVHKHPEPTYTTVSVSVQLSSLKWRNFLHNQHISSQHTNTFPLQMTLFILPSSPL